MREKGVRGERGARVIFMKGLKNERKERENFYFFTLGRVHTGGTFISYKGLYRLVVRAQIFKVCRTIYV